MLSLFSLIAVYFAAIAVASDLPDVVAAALAYETGNFVNGLVTEDPFYTILPPGASEVAPGTILKLEIQSNTTLFTLPPTSSLSRFIYQSKTLNGSLVPVSGYVLWPYRPRMQKDRFAVVAYSHGSSGLTSNCAPSHIKNLWQHFLAPFQLSTQGYVVVATDYAGLGVPLDSNNNTIIHEYMASPAQANDVMYSVQAAQAAFPELSKEFVVVGHSQGGGAAWAAAQRQVSEPVNGYLGAVAISPITDILDTSPTAPALAVAIAPSVAAMFPGFKTTDITTPAAQNALDLIFKSGGCMAVSNALLGGMTNLTQDGWQKNPFLQEWRVLTTNGGREIAGPLLIFHGTSDLLLNFNITVAAVNETIEKYPKSQIDFTLLPGVSHGAALQASQPVWMDWIAARFAGESIPGGSKTSIASPARPLAAQQPNLNWFIGLATEFYETP